MVITYQRVGTSRIERGLSFLPLQASFRHVVVLTSQVSRSEAAHPCQKLLLPLASRWLNWRYHTRVDHVTCSAAEALFDRCLYYPQSKTF